MSSCLGTKGKAKRARDYKGAWGNLGLMEMFIYYLDCGVDFTGVNTGQNSNCTLEIRSVYYISIIH